MNSSMIKISDECDANKSSKPNVLSSHDNIRATTKNAKAEFSWWIMPSHLNIESEYRDDT